jgi:mitogen-activated protein kinase kinase kinase
MPGVLSTETSSLTVRTPSLALHELEADISDILLGTNSTIKFVDFGAAKVIAKGNKTMARTRVANRTKAPGAGGADGAPNMNSLAGTPMYMAPEVIKNEKSGRLGSSDMWSLGCCLLEIVTGRKPWSNLDNEW